jgi:hypothetical protein
MPIRRQFGNKTLGNFCVRPFVVPIGLLCDLKGFSNRNGRSGAPLRSYTPAHVDFQDDVG